MKLRNMSGLTPLGQAVLTRPYAAERTVKSTIIEIPANAKERLTMAEQRAIVIAVGPEAWKDESGPRAKPGDHVMVSAYAGFMTTGPKDGLMYRVINARDIFLRIVDDGK
jgi:co-chaperonin GroES (HSP10)